MVKLISDRHSKSSQKGAAPRKVEFKSPAEFFANNKGIAGFDNVS